MQILGLGPHQISLEDQVYHDDDWLRIVKSG